MIPSSPSSPVTEKQRLHLQSQLVLDYYIQLCCNTEIDDRNMYKARSAIIKRLREDVSVHELMDEIDERTYLTGDFFDLINIVKDYIPRGYDI